MGHLDGRLVVVTGASRGVGFYAAKEIATQGAHVIAIARTVGGLEELDDEIRAAGGVATLVPLNLKDYDAIDRLGGTIHERWGRLDGLLANAGYLGQVTPLSHLDPAIFDDVMNINVTVNYRLIRSLEPLLRQSPSGRAVFVSSGAVRARRPFVAPYSASKAALEAMVKSWSHELTTTNMRANLVDPGTLRTRMRAQYAPGEDPETVRHPAEIAESLVTLLSAETTENGRIYDFPKGEWRT
ncbi:MAG: SDR family NAD(P)-dependent oxidoreductase [Pseudomonadota bacterium]